jgi:hypothetical protein
MQFAHNKFESIEINSYVHCSCEDKLSDATLSLLQRLTGVENEGINAEWLKLQPWMSDAEGEDWEETSHSWAGPCEGKSIKFEQLVQGLCVNVQAAVVAAGPSYPVSLFSDVEERLLRSLPPSQECLTPSDTAMLRGAFPQLLRNFSETDAARLMLLGVHDSEAVGCMVHGVKKESEASASGQNPVDAVFRMAAQISGVDFMQAAASAAFRRRCFRTAAVACIFMLPVLVYGAGRFPVRLRKLLATLAL